MRRIEFDPLARAELDASAEPARSASSGLEQQPFEKARHAEISFERPLLEGNPDDTEAAATRARGASIGVILCRLPIVFGLMTVGASTIDLEHIDCESGERWALK